MRKNTMAFMLALLVSAHFMQAASQSFTATIKPADYLASMNPGFKMELFTGTTSPKIPINSSGPTQVTLIDGQDYLLTVCAAPNSDCLFSAEGIYLKQYFRANKKTPIIVISETARGSGIFTFLLQKS